MTKPNLFDILLPGMYFQTGKRGLVVNKLLLPPKDEYVHFGNSRVPIKRVTVCSFLGNEIITKGVKISVDALQILYDLGKLRIVENVDL